MADAVQNGAMSAVNAATVSSEYHRMHHDWDLIADIMGGVRLIRDDHARRARYLPQFSTLR